MTNQKLNSKLKHTLVLLLTLLLTVCFGVAGLIGCKNSSDSTNPTYSYTYETEKYVNNPSFTKDLATKATTAYPISTISGWEKSYHNSAVSSYVDSGAIDISNDAWAELVKKLKEDNDLIDALAKQYGKTKLEIKQNFDTYYISNELAEGSTDKHVYMFNNYPQNEAYAATQTGTAQRIKSTSKINLEKGKYAKVTVSVKTKNLISHGPEDNYGANISLVSTFNNTTMGEYRLSAIKVSEWTDYTIYVKADEKYDTSITLALGLGFGSGSNTSVKYYTQGTALFDNVKFEILDNIDGVSFAQSTTFDYASEEDYYIVADNSLGATANRNYLFDLSMTLPGSFPEGFFTKLDVDSSFPSVSSDLFTYSNVTTTEGKISSKDIASNSAISATKTADAFTLNLTNASATVKVNSPAFNINANEYKIVSFKIANNLKSFGSEDVTIDVFDVDGTIVEKRPAVVYFDHNAEDDLICNLVIKNNFEENARQFYLEIVVGPAVLTNGLYANELATGEFTISDVYVATGDITDTDASDYDYYSLINSTANGTTDLYAGFTGTPSDGTTANQNFLIKQSPSDLGTIINYPSNPMNYEGVEKDHVYINKDGSVKKINTRSGQGSNGSFAGLINSKYIENYKENLSGVDLEGALEGIDAEVQPLMIYNATGAESYGFIGGKNTVAANSTARISLRVKVDDTAKAYIYLVDVSKSDKNVLTYNNFEAKNYVGEKTVGTMGNEPMKLMLVIDKNSKTSADGWVDVNFYLATGVNPINFRLEMWNGARDGEKSNGLVLFNNPSIATSNGFTESSKWSSALYEDTTSPLYLVDFDESANTSDQLFSHLRPLTDNENSFRVEYPEKWETLKPNVKYVWAKTSNMIYAVYNTFEPSDFDPYSTIEEEEETQKCTTQTDPATFWMSFSTILLSVCLIAAIILLFIKNIIRRRKANASDAKSHYKVQSRIKKESQDKKKEKVKEEIKSANTEEVIDEIITENTEEISEEQTETNEEQKDDYVYGEVQDFGEETTNENVENNPEENN